MCTGAGKVEFRVEGLELCLGVMQKQNRLLAWHSQSVHCTVRCLCIDLAQGLPWRAALSAADTYLNAWHDL